MASNLTEWHIAFDRLKARYTRQPHSTPETSQGWRPCPHVGSEDERCPCVDDDNWAGESR